MTQTQRHMFDNELLIKAKNSFKYAYLGNVSYSEQYDLDELLNNIMTSESGDIKYRQRLNMYEIHRVQKYYWCHQYLIDLLNSCNNSIIENPDIICFAADDIDVGYDWHDDLFDIIATNVVGESTWYFENGDEVHMKPFDLLFVPKGLRHTVKGHTPRFTAAIGNNSISTVQ